MATDWLDRIFNAASAAYSNLVSGLSATTVQDAIDELATDPSRRQQYNGYSSTGLSGTYNQLVIPDFELYASHSIQAVNLGSATINGIKAPAAGADVNGIVKILRLPYGFFTTTLVHDSASAAAEDRIITSTGGSITNSSGGPYDVYALLTRENGKWFATRLGARALNFGTTNVQLSITAPSTNQILTFDGSSVSGVNPSAAAMDRLANNNSSTTAVTFATPFRRTWNGGLTPAFTYSGAGATDGCRVTYFFPVGSITSFTLSTDLDPTGTLAGTYDNTKAALLVMTYFASGPCVATQLFKVSDL